MRIGVDATTWSNRRGYGRFTRALISAAVELDQCNHYTLFVDQDSEEFPLPSGGEVCHIATKVPTIKAAGADSRRSFSDLWAVARAMRRARVDLIFFPSEYSYVPLFTNIPQVVTLHDATSELIPKSVFPTLRARFLFGAKKRMAIRQARLLVTVSEYSRRRLTEQLGIPAARLRVINEAADPIFRPLECPAGSEVFSRWGIPPNAKCMIYVGGFSPHKNLFMLVDVVRELLNRDAFRDLRLVLVGDYAGDSFFSCYRQLAELVSSDRLKERVLFTGRLEDKELVVLLNRADALVLPSLSEGFGLPGVEAAACGTPVVATTESPLPELLGEGMIAVDPRDRAGWLGAIERVLTDTALRGRMRGAGLAAAKRMSWKNSACQLLSVFDEVQRNHVTPT
jgi:glycosyltransferase involved in cell wall biosynthesis